MTAPERIWMFKANIPKNLITMGDTEYVRADLHDATKAQLAKAVEALRKIADQPDYRLPKPQDTARAVLAEIEKGEQK